MILEEKKVEYTKAERARALRYKRPALASLGYDAMRAQLDEIGEACADIHWFMDANDETLVNALDGDEEAEYEFKMAFADLEAKTDQLYDAIQEWSRWDEDEFGRTYDDCTVALLGNRYKSLGYDDMEEDYYHLTGFEGNLAYTEAGKRFTRKTKADMISTIGQCVGILVAFLDLRQSYDYLKATMDILRDDNTSLLKVIKDIQATYEVVSDPDGYGQKNAYDQFDRLLNNLPDKIWME